MDVLNMSSVPTMHVISVLHVITVPIMHTTSSYNVSTIPTIHVASMFNRTFLDSDIEEPKAAPWFYWLPGPLICVFGIVCNILNLCVLSQKELRESPYIYLKAIAFSDLSLLSISFIHLVSSTAPNTFLKAFYNVYIFYAIGNAFYNSSIWLIVALTIERMVFVTRPMKKRPSKSTTRLYIFGIFTFCTFINLPRFFCYEIHSEKNKYFPTGSLFKESDLFYKLSWFQAIVINFIPLFILIVTNITLVYALHKAGIQRQSLGCSREAATLRDQTRLTRTLIAIVVVFFICTIPSAFADHPIAYTIFGKGKTWTEYVNSNENKTFTHIANLLVFLNSSLNFVMYCAFNKKFRTATKNLFLKFKKGLSMMQTSYQTVSRRGRTWAKT